jgi:hypothetical protein
MNALTWKQQRVRELETHIALERIKLDLFEAELEQLSKLTGDALIFRYSYEIEAAEKASEKYMEIMRAAMILTPPNWESKQ